MSFLARRPFVAIAIVMFATANVAAQETAPQQQVVPQQPEQQQAQAPPQAPPDFQLNALQQAQLDQVLDAWQAASGKIVTFQCRFERWEYDVAFGPKDGNIPLNKNVGELTFQKPDKGSFEIKEINKFQFPAAPPGQQPPAAPQGNWVNQPNAIGDHWVCDGKSVYQYRPDLKQLVEHPIPPEFQGQAIADGPLPFLFGADRKKLSKRYWMRIDQQQVQDPINQIGLVAIPKFREQAADFREVDVILDRQQLLPLFMNVKKPNGSRDMYIFDIKKADVNGLFNRMKAAVFARPSLPSGWQRVVENAPLKQAAQPVQPPR